VSDHVCFSCYKAFPLAYMETNAAQWRDAAASPWKARTMRRTAGFMRQDAAALTRR
jgi:hypothetical protein